MLDHRHLRYISPPFPLPPPLSLASALSLSLLPWASLAGHGVAALLVPLHVTDTPHGLELRMAGTKLVEVPEVTLLQQVLAATVSRELVSHPAGGKKRGNLSVWHWLFFYVLDNMSAWCLSCHLCILRAKRHSRSAADNDAAHSVGEAVREQAGNIIVHDLHLAALELSNLVQADLMLLGVLFERTKLV